MRFRILAGLLALGAMPLSAHPRVFVRGGFSWPRPLLVVRPTPVCLEPEPWMIHRREREFERYYRHGRRHYW